MADPIESGTYTPEALQRRLAIAQQLLDTSKTQPIQHWTQGLNELLKGAVGGNLMSQAERAEAIQRNAYNQQWSALTGAPYVPIAVPKTGLERISELLGGGGGGTGGGSTAAAVPSTPPPSAAASAPLPAPPANPPVSSVAAAPFNPNPYGDPSWQNADPSTAVKGVAAALAPPPKNFMDSIVGVSGEFTPTDRAGNVVRAPVPSSSRVVGDKEAEAAGLYPPSATGGTPVAAAAPTAPSPVPAVPPSAMPRSPLTAGIPQSKLLQIGLMMQSPDAGMREMGMKAWAAAVGKEGEIRPITAEERQRFGISPDNTSPWGMDVTTNKPVLLDPRPITDIKLNTALTGNEEMARISAKDFAAAQDVSRDATKRSQIWDNMEKAAKGFTPGATAALKLEVGRYLKDLGITSGPGVPDAEVFRQMQQQIAVHAQPKGQGAVSNVERELFAKAIPNMGMSPEALQRAIQISRDLDNFDRRVAQIWRDSARDPKNKGVPNSVDVNEKIEALGSPISSSDRSFLIAKSEGGGGATKTTATPKPAGEWKVEKVE